MAQRRWRQRSGGTGPGGRLPNLVVIGAGKCGTTALHHYLGAHPQVFMSSPKELDFFAGDLNWRRGPAWYAAHFHTTAPVCGESSVSYTEYPHRPGVPARMASLLPDARLILIVRDPIERIVSSYAFNYQRRLVGRPLAEHVADPGSRLLSKSRYWLQLEQYLEHFPPGQILVVDSHRLRGERRETLREVFAFLGVDPAFDSPAWDRDHNATVFRRWRRSVVLAERAFRRAGAARPWVRIRRRLPEGVLYGEPFEQPVLRDTERELLREQLADDVARLRAFTGQRFPSWSL